MKVLIKKNILETIIINTSSYLDKKDLSSITSHIFINAKDSTLTIKATDNEIGLSYKSQNVNIVDDTNPQTNAQIQNPQLPTQLDMNQIGNLFSVLGQVLHGQSQQGQNQPQQPPKDDKKDEEKKDEGDKK